MSERNPRPVASGTDDASAVDPSRCPLCGEDNRCGNLAGAETCWCADVDFPVELIGDVPKETRNVACVCRRCAVRSPG